MGGFGEVSAKSNLGFCFMKVPEGRWRTVRTEANQDEGISESSVETLEKTLVPRLIWTGCLHVN